MRVLFSPHPGQHLLFPVILITGVSWQLLVVLTPISLMMGDAEHLFMDLLAVCRLSLEKCLFKSSAHVLIGWCGELLFIFDVELCVFSYVWILKPFFISAIRKYFLPFTALPFILMASIVVQRRFSPMQPRLLILAFVPSDSGVRSKDWLPRLVSRSLPPMFASRSYSFRS